MAHTVTVNSLIESNKQTNKQTNIPTDKHSPAYHDLAIVPNISQMTIPWRNHILRCHSMAIPSGQLVPPAIYFPHLHYHGAISALVALQRREASQPTSSSRMIYKRVAYIRDVDAGCSHTIWALRHSYLDEQRRQNGQCEHHCSFGHNIRISLEQKH
jgi:hypothetical protein